MYIYILVCIYICINVCIVCAYVYVYKWQVLSESRPELELAADHAYSFRFLSGAVWRAETQQDVLRGRVAVATGLAVELELEQLLLCAPYSEYSHVGVL
jgi:hypothetical protein